MILLLWTGVLAGAAAAHALALRRRRELLATLAILDLTAAVLVAAAALDGSAFVTWMQEDGPAEWATVFAFAGAAGIWARRALGRRGEEAARGSRPERVAAAAMAAFCLFVAGEEISWGQRLLAFEPPEIFLAANYQQELNVHNFLEDRSLGPVELDSRYLVVLVSLGLGVLLPVMARLRRRMGGLGRVAAEISPPVLLAPAFGAVAVAELTYPVPLTGEASELFLGLAMLAAVLFRPQLSPRGTPAEGRWIRLRTVGTGAALVAPVLLGGLAPPGIDRLVYGPNEGVRAAAAAELESLRADLAGGAVQPALLGKRRVHKRLFTAVRAGYLRFGDGSRFLERQPGPAETDGSTARRDRRGYFLDPWRQPYWIYFDGAHRRAMVYSFGPNRRRDLRFRDGLSRVHHRGDDVLVTVRLGPSG